MTSYRDEFPKPFSITRWLCISSCFLLIPGAYAFSQGLYLLSLLCILACITSFNHWRCAENGYRRNADKLVAWVCFIVFFISGCIDCEGSQYYNYAVSIILISVTFSFLLSGYLSMRWNPFWCSTHIFFHLFSALASSFVVYCAVQKQNIY